MVRWNRGIARLAPGLALGLMVLASSSRATAENLEQAWAISLGVNQGLQAQQQTSIAADFQVKAANSARYFTVKSYNIDAFLAQSPKVKPTISGSSSSPITALPTVFLLGSKQSFFRSR